MVTEIFSSIYGGRIIDGVVCFYSEDLNSVFGNPIEDEICIRLSGVVDSRDPRDSTYVKLDEVNELSVDDLENRSNKGDKRKDSINRMKSLKEALEGIETQKTTENDCLVARKEDLNRIATREAKNMGCDVGTSISNYGRSVIGDEDSQKELIIGPVFISMKSIQTGQFDFQDYLKTKRFPTRKFCSKCNSEMRDYEGHLVKPIPKLKLCSDCVDEITLKCAKISGNKTLISEMVAGQI